ncbi:hypothetical protein SKAU_G00024260 [Synaphobranchus kaupii]|uniref:Uncharacterized protein n=1 Tax=Synaphobranchus kaupii TaxID=118154 RepID=A0A9Q1GDM7_SYNKA|nr:hypothetical protein SKAU_G00024260 [Synaphobranchus kaupii]
MSPWEMEFHKLLSIKTTESVNQGKFCLKGFRTFRAFEPQSAARPSLSRDSDWGEKKFQARERCSGSVGGWWIKEDLQFPKAEWEYCSP